MKLRAHQRQSGSALIISLIILLVMTILGVQGMQNSTLEEKMAGNFRDRALAFEAAEAALLAAEDFLNSADLAPVATTDGAATRVWAFGTPWVGASDLTQAASWGQTGAWNVTTLDVQGTDNGQLSAVPQYIIEERVQLAGTSQPMSAETGALSKASASGQLFSYRITARGVGSTSNSVVLLRSNFEKVY